MADNKTKATDQSVAAFVAAVPDAQRRQDSQTLIELMRAATGEEPKLWGSSLIGLGQYHYIYASGREGDMFLAGFSPRKPALVLYLNGGLEAMAPLLEKLGKYKTGKGCIYIKNLDEVHLPTLKKMIAQSAKTARQRHN